MKPVILIILDGWGIAPPGAGNAISLAHLSHIPRLGVSYPHTELAAAGAAVGLPEGEDGNTETGHINIGAGRVVYQDFSRINMSIADGSFFRNDALVASVAYANQHHSNLHIMGLVSDSAVHASLEHLFALLLFLKQRQCERVYLHLFTDGRDSPPRSSQGFLAQIEARCQSLGVGKIATIMGRYFAMDRDRRWERTEKAYNALTSGAKRSAPSAQQAVTYAYGQGETDEFIEPTVIIEANSQPFPRITNHDSVIFYNFRIDRPRQLTRAFVMPNFETHTQSLSFDPYTVKYYHKHVVADDTRRKPFTRNTVLPNLFFVTMTEYERGLSCIVAFPPQPVKMPLGRVFSEAGLRQLRLSETEKERFIGYYFNGMREDPFDGEDRIIVPSPNVATYDLKPEMSAYELTERLLDRLSIGVYACIVINFANPDMVAHTGNIPAAIRACEVADACVGKIVRAAMAINATCIITADHGNVEEMLGPQGEVDTEHSTLPVPVIIVDHVFDNQPIMLPKGKLADIAPTLLSLRNLPIPQEMTGKNLLQDFMRKG